MRLVQVLLLPLDCQWKCKPMTAHGSSWCIRIQVMPHPRGPAREAVVFVLPDYVCRAAQQCKSAGVAAAVCWAAVLQPARDQLLWQSQEGSPVGPCHIAAYIAAQRPVLPAMSQSAALLAARGVRSLSIRLACLPVCACIRLMVLL